MGRQSNDPTRDELAIFEIADRVAIVRESHGPAEAIRVAEAALASAAAAIVALGPPAHVRGRKDSPWPGQPIPLQPPLVLFGSELAGVGTVSAVTTNALAPLDEALDRIAQRVQRIDRVSNALARSEWGAQLEELVPLMKGLAAALGRLEERARAVLQLTRPQPAPLTQMRKPRRGRPAA
jgi:hypothetical protein